jgi:cytochrome c-type biogenesis protein CcmH
MRRLRFRLVVPLLAALAAATSGLAVQPDEVLKDPALEARARELSRELRCMVCQNQSIDDSDAPLARDLRVLVRERLKAGDSNKDVIDFLTVRYGDFVLLRPRFTWSTALLWIMPAVFVGAGVISLLVLLRRRRIETGAEPQLTPAEQARLAEVIERNE